MGRSVASIQAEIDILEAELTNAASVIASATSDNTTVTRTREKLERRLDELYVQLDRASGAAPMIVRGVVKGLH
jgi:hypothetical protein